MESNKLDKKLRDWTISLGFRLPDGSAPPPDFFAFLTVTPHRRQLWETLMETVQPRQKVEMMRKQIFVSKLQEKKKYLSKFDSKQGTDRIDLWYKQNALESEINEKRKAIIKMEKSIMESASSLIYEMYRVAELENQVKELDEKCMVLKLLSRRQKKAAEDLNKDLVTAKALFCDNSAPENLEKVKNELLSLEKCSCLQGDVQECSLLNKIKMLSESGVTEKQLWEEVIRWKKTLLSDFTLFFSEFNSTEKNTLSEKRARAETVLSQSIAQLKQKITQKSLQVIINSAEGKQLDLEIEKLEDRVLDKILCNEFCEETLYNIFDKINVSSEESKMTVKNFKNYANFIGLKSYEEFLKEKVKKLEEKIHEQKRKDELKNSEGMEEKLQCCFKEYESIVDEINCLKSEGKKIKEEIIDNHEKLEAIFRSQKEEMDAKINAKTLQEVVDKLKMAGEKQMNLILDTPLGAFRTVKTSSGRLIFECELATHCLKSYPGQLKHFFSTMLIPPANDLSEILSEIDRRKKSLNRVEMFISEREKLAALQKETRHQLTSVRHDSQLCERNFKESDRILCGISYKAKALLQDMDFIEKILKNWVEQPYRLMIKGTIEGKSLRECEEKYRKIMN